ncbi:MAG: hypothetical protein HYR87_07805 [Thaumarchaeota archaeon]|nr:hypothetical protein [Nitrososphaerota archaeon]
MIEKNKSKVISFRVTESELEKIKKVADLTEKTIAEWCKSMVLKATDKDYSAGLGLINLGDRMLVEEFTALRIVLLNTLTDEKLTEEKLKRIVKKAEEMKKEKAQDLIKEFMLEDIK